MFTFHFELPSTFQFIFQQFKQLLVGRGATLLSVTRKKRDIVSNVGAGERIFAYAMIKLLAELVGEKKGIVNVKFVEIRQVARSLFFAFSRLVGIFRVSEQRFAGSWHSNNGFHYFVTNIRCVPPVYNARLCF